MGAPVPPARDQLADLESQLWALAVRIADTWAVLLAATAKLLACATELLRSLTAPPVPDRVVVTR